MRLHLLVLALSFVALSCGTPPKKCNSTTCASGCCDAAGECQAGTVSNACGQLGATCQVCIPGESCSFGLCRGSSSGGGSGGGGGTTGGGGGSVTGGGGGSVTGGGGGSVTGGGGGSVTGGGGGSVTGGGGGSVTGGGGGSVTGGGGGSVTGGGGGSSIPGDRCDTAIALVAGVPLSNQNLASFSNDYDGTGTNCAGSASPDVTYQLVVPPGQVATVVVTPDATFDAALSVADSATTCNGACVAGVDLGFEGEPEQYQYRNTTTAPKTIFLVVDGYGGSTGTFTLLATLATPPADDVCTAPIALTVGVSRTGQTLANYTDDYSAGSACAGFNGPDRVYSVTVPNGQRLTVVATPGATTDVALSLVDVAANCGLLCLAGADADVEGAVETLTFNNATGASKTWLVVVDSPTATGTFDLLASLATTVADDVCGGATSLPAAMTISGTTVGYTDDYESLTGALGCTNGTLGPDRVYAVSVGNNQRATVTVTPTTSGFNPTLNLIDGSALVCSAQPRVCAGGASFAPADAPETASVFNMSGSAKTYFAIVDSLATSGGAYTIGYTVGAPPANDVCGTNTLTLTAGTRSAETLSGFAGDYYLGADCLPSRGPDRVYRVQLAANQRYTGTVTPVAADAGMDPVIKFIPGPAASCEAAPRTCRGGADEGLRSAAETASFTNSTGGALDLYVIVADYEPTSSLRDFSLVSSFGTAPPGESCTAPLAVSAGAVQGQTTTGATPDVFFSRSATGCVPTGRAPDRVYSLVVPAGQTLTVVATPAAMEDLILNVIDGPASTCLNVTTCAASADRGADGVAETATFLNSTAGAKTVFLQVSGYALDLNYSLAVTIQ